MTTTRPATPSTTKPTADLFEVSAKINRALKGLPRLDQLNLLETVGRNEPLAAHLLALLKALDECGTSAERHSAVDYARKLIGSATDG